MALTQLADIVQRTMTFDWVLQQSVSKNALIRSGAVAVDPRMNVGLAGSGLTFNFRAVTPPSNNTEASSISSDATGDVLTPFKVSSTKQIVTRLDRNKGHSVADLASGLAGIDFLNAVVSELSTDQAKDRQVTMMSTLTGVMAENGDAYDIALETLVGQDATNWISPEAIVTARNNAWGDAATPSGDTIVMHSVVYARAQIDNLIDFTATNVQNIGWGTYLGMAVIVDDTTTKVAGATSGFKYSTYLIQAGALKLGVGRADLPLELDRQALQGNGAGVGTLVARDVYAVHMEGMSYTGTPAADSASDTEIALAANWAKVYDRKNVGVAELISNG